MGGDVIIASCMAVVRTTIRGRGSNGGGEGRPSYLVSREQDGGGSRLLDGPLPQTDQVRSDTHGPTHHKGQREDVAVCRRRLSCDAPAALKVLYSQVSLFADHVLLSRVVGGG